MRLVWTPPAEADRNAIYDYIEGEAVRIPVLFMPHGNGLRRTSPDPAAARKTGFFVQHHIFQDAEEDYPLFERE